MKIVYFKFVFRFMDFWISWQFIIVIFRFVVILSTDEDIRIPCIIVLLSNIFYYIKSSLLWSSCMYQGVFDNIDLNVCWYYFPWTNMIAIKKRLSVKNIRSRNFKKNEFLWPQINYFSFIYSKFISSFYINLSFKKN